MIQWPKSAWPQAGIALVAAIISSVVAFHWTSNHRFDQYAVQYPRDGQDGLAAGIDGLFAGGVTLLVVFILLFAVQRVSVRR